MRLILNLSMLGAKPTGLGVYSEHCARALAERFDVGVIAGSGFMPDRGQIVAEAPASIAVGGGKLAALRRQFWMRSLSFGSDALVYSPTHHGPPNISGQIITVHDLICLRFPSQHKPQFLFFKYVLPRLLKKCRAVFTVSDTTRHDIADTYGYPLDKIFVVPNGVNTGSFQADPSARPQDPYLLMVGARYPHKNVDDVLRQAAHWSKDYRLLVTSCGGKYKEHLLQLVDQLGLRSRVEFRDYVSRDDLIKLYQGCSALVYPSKWEGFGIPPLEAMACGSPVIASDIPVHREVLGSSALFVKLGDSASWGEAFAKLGNADSVASHLAAGQDVLRRFTWENSAAILEKNLLSVEPRLVRR